MLIARIEIGDTGIGMEPGLIAQAFQPSIQLHTGNALITKAPACGCL